MKHFKASVIIFAVCLVIVSCDIGDYDEAVRRGNDFVDKILHDVVTEHGSDYDPYHLGESSKSFYKKVMFVNVTGEAKFHSGFIRGLSTLSRVDGCHLKEEGDRLIIKAEMGAGVLDMQYSGTATFMSYGPTITAHGTCDYVEISMVMSCDSDTGKNGELTQFHIDEMKGEKVWITGLGLPLNWAVNTIANMVKNWFRGFITRAVEKQIEGYIAKKIRDYDFPVEKPTTLQPTDDETIATDPENVELMDKAFDPFLKRNAFFRKN